MRQNPIHKKVTKNYHSVLVDTTLRTGPGGACLAEQIKQVQVEDLALGIVEWDKALAPAGETTSVFRDSGFGDDVAKTNLAAMLKQHGIANVGSL